jgi:tetratricopeptide (TPR) repeat protein
MYRFSRFSLVLNSAVVVVLTSPLPVLAQVSFEGTDSSATASELLRQGLIKIRRWDYKGAIELCGRAIAKDTQAEAYRCRGLAREHLEDDDGALADYEEAIRIAPNDSLAHYYRAGIKRRRRLEAAAEADLRRAIALASQEAEGHWARGLAQLALGDAKAAIESLDLAITTNAADPRFFTTRGVARAHLSDLKGAQADTREALRLDPLYLSARKNLGLQLIDTREFDAALEQSEHLLALAPDKATGYLHRARIRLSQGNFDLALADAGRVIALHPEWPEGYTLRATVHMARQKPQQALIDLDTALDSGSLNTDPKYAEALMTRGSIKLQMGNVSGAEADFNQLIALRPKDAFAYLARAGLHRHTKHIPLALADLDRAVALTPSPTILKSRGEMHIEMKNWEKALADFNRVVELVPDFVGIHYGLGLARIGLGEWQEALTALDRSLELLPAHGPSYASRALVHAKLKQWQQSIEDYGRAIAALPDEPGLFLERGAVYAELHEKMKAIADWQKAAELYSARGDAENRQRALDLIERINRRPNQTA